MVLLASTSVELVPLIVGVKERLSLMTLIPLVSVSVPPVPSATTGAVMPPVLLMVMFPSVFAPKRLKVPPPLIVTLPVLMICPALPKVRGTAVPATTLVPVVMVTVLVVALITLIAVITSPAGMPLPITVMPTERPVALGNVIVLLPAVIVGAVMAVVSVERVALLISVLPGITVVPARPPRLSVPWWTKVPPV